ncbi:MAG TPA: Smr/MutS family protein [Candidatus Kryptonia bacterium]|nr:Smr/MutS family protein [Candidatus Kryptonia bacterium]
MRQRGQRSNASGQAKPKDFKHQPFRQLGKLVATTAPVKPQAPPKALRPAAPVVDDDATAFLREMADVARLGEHHRGRVAEPPPASPPREVINADAEALAELSELVTGAGPFDISDSDEHVEAVAAGVDPRLVRRLRAGEFAYQAHLDLHRLTVADARSEFDRFMTAARQGGLRCVLIIHGRGRNSKDQVPILKPRVVSWLAHGQWARFVLAFASARACDGGVGALYVLLRRDRKKRPVHVLNGGKW